MQKSLLVTAALGLASLCVLAVPPPVAGQHAGQPLVIELDNAFIQKYANQATITSVVTISGISATHPPKNDGEVHIGGWCHDVGLAGVSEVMNAATTGRKATLAFRKALSAKQRTVTVTGAWRLWGEHPGTGPQIQQAAGPNPAFDPPIPSNPPHVFEIHPVTTAKIGGDTINAAAAIGETPGFTPHDATKAFVLGYEKLSCTLVPLDNGRTKIITEALGFNFTEFVIRKDKHEVTKLDDGGQAVRCSVFDTDGELLLRDRRMIFLKGTEADDEVETLVEGKMLQVIGIPRIDLALVQWRLDHKDGKDDSGKKFDVNPLEWRLPYEMIIVAAKPYMGEAEPAVSAGGGRSRPLGRPGRWSTASGRGSDEAKARHLLPAMILLAGH